MSQGVNNFPSDSNYTYVVVTGGDINRPAPDQSGTVQALDPARHGPNINSTDLPFITTLRDPTMESQETTPHPPEPGSVMTVSWTTGEPTGRVALGLPNDIFQGGGMTGNMDLASFPNFQEAFQRYVKKVISQGYQTTSQDGAEIRKPKNGQYWNHNSAKGIRTDAAMYPLAGTRLPEIQNIETAIQHFANILDPGILSQLSSNFSSLSSAFNNLSTSQKAAIQANTSPQMYQAMSTMMNLMQSGDSSTSRLVGTPVDAQHFANNIVALLSNVKSHGDLHNTLHNLMTNTDLQGANNLGSITYTANTAFGNVAQTISPTGNVQNNNNNLAQQLQAFISLLLSGAGGLGGSLLNTNIFGKHASTMGDLPMRLPTNIGSFRNSQLSQLQGLLQSHDKTHKQTITPGGNPLSGIIN